MLQGGAGSFEGAGDRVDADVEHGGYLAGVKAQDVAQDEDGDLAGRQGLKGGHEGQRDGFGLLVAGLGAWWRIDDPDEKGVGEGLQPGGLAALGRLGRFHPGDIPLPSGAATGRAARVEAPVGGDLVQPGAQRGAALEPGQALPGGQQRVLQGILGVGEGSEHPVAVHLQFPLVRLGQFPERIPVPGPRP